MKITVNNKNHNIKSQTIAEMMQELQIESKGVAIAINNRVVSQSDWNKTQICEDDKIVVVSAVFGG